MKKQIKFINHCDKFQQTLIEAAAQVYDDAFNDLQDKVFDTYKGDRNDFVNAYINGIAVNILKTDQLLVLDGAQRGELALAIAEAISENLRMPMMVKGGES